MNSRKKVAVAMSGGVDSSVAAALLVEQGYEVTGVYLEAYNEPGCRTDQDKADALKVAITLGVSFKTLDLRKEYREKVTEYFVESYRRGETPNPDVVCNREIKFGEFYRWAREEGYDFLATGHYCRIKKRQGTVPCNWLQRGWDETKDQSYFLWQVPQEHLKRIIFPLGEMKKHEVREKARSLGLPNAEKPDSMGVCMMGKLNVREFLKSKLKEREGEVVMSAPTKSSDHLLKITQGSELYTVGTHTGLWFSTIGQRVGKEVALQGRTLKEMGIDTTKMPIMYVVGKKVGENRIIIGKKEECYVNKFQITNSKLQMGKDELARVLNENKLFVRIRNLGELYKILKLKTQKSKLESQKFRSLLHYVAERRKIGTRGKSQKFRSTKKIGTRGETQKSKLNVELEKSVFAPTKGQSAVLYARLGKEGEEIVVGGGIITKVPISPAERRKIGTRGRVGTGGRGE